MNAAEVKALALEAGFDLAGIAPAVPAPDAARYAEWVAAGLAGAMGYLTDHRASRRMDPCSLLPGARSILCVAKLYNGPEPYTPDFSDSERGWISRYAWGDDYHGIMREALERVAGRLKESVPDLEYKVCVDTAPLLERSCARLAGLGWIGKNTCLINESAGSWLFLGELLLSVRLDPDAAVDDRCGSCTACIDACPTDALQPGWLDARRCISYLTIELRDEVPEDLRPATGRHLFGCDICQDVCPWNRRAPIAAEPRFTSRNYAPPLERLAAMSEREFRALFRDTPVSRTRYSGFLRNVAIAMGNTGDPEYRPALARLAGHPDTVIAEHATWALRKLAVAVREEPA
ncbi:MAG TPA: tRNA epoxyqueuosine(34) reductase QueG [Bryobacteraceae bacterium]|nr:tRNA epoxyqueuosine(34) reductase QueG [Bryobacteraceae bacterium]